MEKSASVRAPVRVFRGGANIFVCSHKNKFGSHFFGFEFFHRVAFNAWEGALFAAKEGAGDI